VLLAGQMPELHVPQLHTQLPQERALGHARLSAISTSNQETAMKHHGGRDLPRAGVQGLLGTKTSPQSGHFILSKLIR
jgi:hypothetical protein